jgi:hypothetical protein
MKPAPKGHEDHHHPHSHDHDHGHHYHYDFDKHTDKAMAWYGWGSAVGLSIFIMSLGVFLVLLHYAGLIG